MLQLQRHGSLQMGRQLQIRQVAHQAQCGRGCCCGRSSSESGPATQPSSCLSAGSSERCIERSCSCAQPRPTTLVAQEGNDSTTGCFLRSHCCEHSAPVRRRRGREGRALPHRHQQSRSQSPAGHTTTGTGSSSRGRCLQQKEAQRCRGESHDAPDHAGARRSSSRLSTARLVSSASLPPSHTEGVG